MASIAILSKIGLIATDSRHDTQHHKT